MDSPNHKATDLVQLSRDLVEQLGPEVAIDGYAIILLRGSTAVMSANAADLATLAGRVGQLQHHLYQRIADANAPRISSPFQSSRS